MQANEFEFYANKLRKAFSDKVFSSEKNVVVYEAICNYPEKVIDSTVRHILEEFTRFPKVSEIVTIANDYFRQHKIEEAKKTPAKPQSDCYRCHSTGFIIAKKKVYEFKYQKDNTFAFKCSCSFGKMNQAAIPAFDEMDGFYLF